jgi:hypothetical protein
MLKLFHTFKDIVIYHWHVGDIPVYYCDENLLDESERGFWYTTDPEGQTPYNFDVRWILHADDNSDICYEFVSSMHNHAFASTVITIVDRSLRCTGGIHIRNKVTEDIEKRRQKDKKKLLAAKLGTEAEMSGGSGKFDVLATAGQGGSVDASFDTLEEAIAFVRDEWCSACFAVRYPDGTFYDWKGFAEPFSFGLAQEFWALVRRWKDATAFESSSTKLVNHPAYQQIIALGPPVVPLLLRQLRDNADHWSWALAMITGENPAPESASGKLYEVAEAWLQWGRQHGLISRTK